MRVSVSTRSTRRVAGRAVTDAADECAAPCVMRWDVEAADRDTPSVTAWHQRVTQPANASRIYRLWKSVYKNPKRLSVPRSQRALTLYPVTDSAAATDISGVGGRWQLSR